MKYLIVGSGGREHTIYWRLLNDGSSDEVYVAPGNGGIEKRFRVDIPVDDFDGLTNFSKEKGIDMVIVGPEAPLVDGLVDYLEENGITAFGPTKKAAQLEGSKIFTKEILNKYNVPTGWYKEYIGKDELIKYIESVDKYPIVIKLDGLAAGKGVGIPENKDEALSFINKMVKDDSRVLIEELLVGEEASVLGISDGDVIKMFVAAQDHKRIFDGDKGPNTGGMGAYAPAPVMTSEKLKRVHDEILKPTIDGMKNEGMPFKGILYAGLMVNGDDIKVLEYNVRFGDPEVQVIMPLLKGKLGDIFEGAVNGTLKDVDFLFSDEHAITVVMSSVGYPGDYETGIEITGLDSVDKDLIVFHAGTKEENGRFYTNGGRVLNVTATGSSLKSAKDFVHREIDKIKFEGAHYRKDIAYRAL